MSDTFVINSETNIKDICRDLHNYTYYHLKCDNNANAIHDVCRVMSYSSNIQTVYINSSLTLCQLTNIFNSMIMNTRIIDLTIINNKPLMVTGKALLSLRQILICNRRVKHLKLYNIILAQYSTIYITNALQYNATLITFDIESEDRILIDRMLPRPKMKSM